MNRKTNNRHTAQQVADILGIYKRTLFNWEEAGKIPKAKRDPMNNYRYYTKEDINGLKKKQNDNVNRKQNKNSQFS